MASLYEDPTQKRHFLFDLFTEEDTEMTLGRGKSARIPVGKGINNTKLQGVSDEHAIIVYNKDTNQFTYIDKKGTCVKRELRIISLENIGPFILENGDQIYLAREINQGYGPLIFSEERRKTNRDSGGSQSIE